jgi:molybdopterin-containing oxidoreductase family iron-sulfur binding subunit
MKESSRTPLEKTVDEARRGFLKTTATATAVVTLAPGVFLHQAQAKAPDEAVTDEKRWGMLIDANKCADNCSACVEGCNREHHLDGHGRPETDAQWIRKVSVKNRETGHAFTLPMMCQHCETAPCADVCPTGASFRRADGIVLVDKHICIGCRYCMMACPYKARSFIHEKTDNQSPVAPRGKGTVESCTLCVHRVDKDGENAIPACAEACMKDGHEAMLFGDLKDPNSRIAKSLKKYGSTQIRADLGLNTGISYWGIS